MLLWVSCTTPKHELALHSNLIAALDTKLNLLTNYIPIEFQRRPNENSRVHPLRDVQRWKATELRQCLLYTVIFRNILSKYMYNNFMYLCISMRILLTPYANNDFINYVHDLLKSI